MVAYLTGDASGHGFGSILWFQKNLVSEEGDHTPLYQGINYKLYKDIFWLKKRKTSEGEGELNYAELLVLSDNLVFEIVLF